MTFVLGLLAAGGIFIAVLAVYLVVAFCLILAALFAWFAVFETPARHADAVVSGFAWRRSMKIGRRVWVKQMSTDRPTGEVRNMEEHLGSGDRYYTYEEQLWRPTGRVAAGGDDRESVRWPDYAFGPGEEVLKRSESYTVMFSSAEGKRYKANVDLRQWQSLEMGAECRLGRTVFGSVRAVRPVPS